jgi:hypothetical protein
MPYDENGNLTPLMLSDLIRQAQEALEKHGDMILWVETEESGYDDTERHSLPAQHAEVVFKPNLHGYWQGKDYDKAFTILGA